mmetsp:Transcript_18319/g.28695  ORF Transcript_18319/g.28695 Transcript_18319/m.28695 type:complete len:273 (-) Transcript_18319:40-858(-)
MEIDRRTGRLRKHTTVSPLPTPRKKEEKEEGGEERRDGRLNNQFRKIYLKSGVNSHGNGSAYIEISGTKVLCTVFGPREAAKIDFRDEARLQCELTYAAFAVPNVRTPFIPDAKAKHLSLVMEQSLQSSIQLHKYPKTSIDVNVLILEDDGGALPAAINCAAIALADAGIEMYDVVCSCGVAFSPTLMLDPTREEEEEGKGTMVVAYLPHLEEISHIMHTSGEISPQSFAEAMEICVDGCVKLQKVMKEALEEGFKKEKKGGLFAPPSLQGE